MKLKDHVLNIRRLINQAIDNHFSKLGISAAGLSQTVSPDDVAERKSLEQIVLIHQKDLNDYREARQETITECVFTLFNRIGAIKVMESREIFPEVIRTRAEHGNLSYAHRMWVENRPEARRQERMGLKDFLISQFSKLSDEYRIPLFRQNHPYAVIPTADELSEIISAFNAIDDDEECGEQTWKSDDILGWLYENFNAVEKKALKDSDEKIEYDKVSLQSQVYTPGWVVKFLVDNTLGKLYLEMFPDSRFTVDQETGETKYLIANAPKTRVRQQQKLEEIKLIDPACGSGNFLIYAFSMFYDMYVDQMENYEKKYSRRDIPKIIVENNLYGVDLDERAVQLTQIALFIKCLQLNGRRGNMPEYTHVVSSHFSLPDFSEIEPALCDDGNKWDIRQKKTLRNIWSDLSNASKFGSLIRLKEQFDALLPHEEIYLFTNEQVEQTLDFKRKAIDDLRNHVGKWSGEGSNDYSLSQVSDAMTFLDILTRSFDVAVANPPYTNSSDFGQELKAFIEANYGSPLKFNSNLYSCFIKRCCELTDEEGKVGLIHPPTFMYIKTFADTRKFIVDHTHISLFVEWGYLGIFTPSARVDSAFYVLEKRGSKAATTFIKLNDLYEMKRQAVLFNAYSDFCQGKSNSRVYTLSQDKFKSIKSWPFIYYISDEFREKFVKYSLSKCYKVDCGFKTGNNSGALRFFWEIDSKEGWYPYVKGGSYNKWYGNNWLLVDGRNDFSYIKNQNSFSITKLYDQIGVTFNGISTKGICFRLLERMNYFDMKSPAIFGKRPIMLLGIMNSIFIRYCVECLDSTVSVQPNDVKRLPYIDERNIENLKANIIERLSGQCISIKQHLCEFSLVEQTFKHSPIGKGNMPETEIARYYDYENGLLTQILINEAIINDIVFDIYELSPNDRRLVTEKEGTPVGGLSVSAEALDDYRQWLGSNGMFLPSAELKTHLDKLHIDDNQPRINDFDTLYQKNNWWEDFCVKHSMNPIEVWHQFRQAKAMPPQRTQVLAFELVTDAIRSVLAKDDDGVVPLTGRVGEEQMSLRIEQELADRGYSGAQIAQIFLLLGRPIESYLQNAFFNQLTNHLNLFPNLVKAPFIWHISSGPHHALELLVSIYRWSRDTLYRIKSVYVANRESSLTDRLNDIDTSTAAGEIERADVREQLVELKGFAEKVDKLLASGYDPVIDDGVGKNIAPLQKAGILSYDVLSSNQLTKYLNADW